MLDLLRLFPGSFISLMLDDFGAEVIMVEHLEGEPGRKIGSFRSKISGRDLWTGSVSDIMG